MEEIREAIKSIERRVHLPDGFLDRLLEEDDWSFVIKGHALLESVCSELVVQLMGNPNFSNAVSRMELSNKYTGKMAFIEASGLLDKKERGFIYALSTLRNDLVHNVSNVGFSFSSHVASLDHNQKSNFIEAFGFAFYTFSSGKVEGSDREFILREPKQAAWLSLQAIVAMISLHIDIVGFNREANESKLQILELDGAIQRLKNAIEKT